MLQCIAIFFFFYSLWDDIFQIKGHITTSTSNYLKGLKYIIKFVFMALWSLLYKLEKKNWKIFIILGLFFPTFFLGLPRRSLLWFHPILPFLLRVHFQVLVQFNTTVMTLHQHMNSHQYWLNLLSNSIQSIVKTLYNYILHLYLINVFWETSSKNYAANYATCTLTMLSKSYQYN